MNYHQINTRDVVTWCAGRLQAGHRVEPVFGDAPEGAEFDNGVSFDAPVVTAWADRSTGEEIAVVYSRPVPMIPVDIGSYSEFVDFLVNTFDTWRDVVEAAEGGFLPTRGGAAVLVQCRAPSSLPGAVTLLMPSGDVISVMEFAAARGSQN